MKIIDTHAILTESDMKALLYKHKDLNGIRRFLYESLEVAVAKEVIEAECAMSFEPARNPCPICGNENDTKYFHCSLDCADEALARVKGIA